MKKVLLHICCAPCAGSVLPRLREMGYEVVFYFENSNIAPKNEYDARLAEVIRWSRKEKIELHIANYNHDGWLAHIAGLENEREGLLRCVKCFDWRLEATAKKAQELNIKYFASTLTNSRHKRADTINPIGQKFAEKYDLIFLAKDWKKGGGENLSVEISKREGFFRQTYCGCEFSMRK